MLQCLVLVIKGEMLMPLSSWTLDRCYSALIWDFQRAPSSDCALLRNPPDASALASMHLVYIMYSLPLPLLERLYHFS